MHIKYKNEYTLDKRMKCVHVSIKYKKKNNKIIAAQNVVIHAASTKIFCMQYWRLFYCSCNKLLKIFHIKFLIKISFQSANSPNIIITCGVSMESNWVEVLENCVIGQSQSKINLYTHILKKNRHTHTLSNEKLCGV